MHGHDNGDKLEKVQQVLLLYTCSSVQWRRATIYPITVFHILAVAHLLCVLYSYLHLGELN